MNNWIKASVRLPESMIVEVFVLLKYGIIRKGYYNSITKSWGRFVCGGGYFYLDVIHWQPLPPENE